MPPLEFGDGTGASRDLASAVSWATPTLNETAAVAEGAAMATPQSVGTGRVDTGTAAAIV
jgi:hypothetical protein